MASPSEASADSEGRQDIQGSQNSSGSVYNMSKPEAEPEKDVSVDQNTSVGDAEETSPVLGDDPESPPHALPVPRSYAQVLQLAVQSDGRESSQHNNTNPAETNTPWVPEAEGAHNDLWGPNSSLPQPGPRHPKAHWTARLPSGQTHNEGLNLGVNGLEFGKLIHIDWVENEPWTDRPAIVTGVNAAARRVRVFPVYSFGDAGGIWNKFGTPMYKNLPARKEWEMKQYVQIVRAASGLEKAHFGTPVVRLSGDQLNKSCWVFIGKVVELPFDRVCRQSVNGVLVEAWLPLDQMKVLKTHARFTKSSLFPSVEDGRLEEYDAPWEGFQDYGKK